MLERMELIAPAHVDNPFTFSFRPPESLPNPLLRMDKVSAGYGDKVILKSIKLNTVPGSRIGLLGRNGAGKSTLIKLLAGTTEPLSGEIGGERHQAGLLRPAPAGIPARRRIAAAAPEPHRATGAGAAAARLSGRFRLRGDKVSEVTERFSGGEKARLVLALIVWQRPNLLLLDEPTNHGSRHASGADRGADRFRRRVGGGLARPSPAAFHHRRSVPVHDGGRAFRGRSRRLPAVACRPAAPGKPAGRTGKESGGNSAQARKDQKRREASSVRRPNRCASRSPSWNSRWKNWAPNWRRWRNSWRIPHCTTSAARPS